LPGQSWKDVLLKAIRNAEFFIACLSTETVALYLMHPHRSKEAFVALIDDWQGILVSDGYSVYQDWVNRRHTCLAHLIRTARGLAEKRQADLAACGAWALKELQRLCAMAKAPPTGGAWRAWYARLCTLIDRKRSQRLTLPLGCLPMPPARIS